MAWYLAGLDRKSLISSEFLDGLVDAGDVREAHLGSLFRDLLGLGLAKLHLLVVRTCSPAT